MSLLIIAQLFLLRAIDSFKRRRDGAAATKVVRPLESRVETAAKAPTGFAEIVSDDFPVFHRPAMF
jgi:hypothetical protein